MFRATLAMLALAAVGPAGSGTQGAPALASWVGRAERAVRPASRPPPPLRGAAARRTRVPILMYHLIHAAPAAAPYPELWVPPRRFAAQMRALHRGGYTGVTLRDALAAWRGGAPLPRRPVVVSFDDGYASQGAVAFRVLHRLGWPGVIAPVTAQIGPGELSARRIRRMLRAGWELESHTVTHPELPALDDRALSRELVVSRRRLQRRFGVRVDVLCYPSGRYSDRVEAAARRAGYRAATTTDEGVAGARDPSFELPRIRVGPEISPRALVRRLARDAAPAG